MMSWFSCSNTCLVVLAIASLVACSQDENEELATFNERGSVDRDSRTGSLEIAEPSVASERARQIVPAESHEGGGGSMSHESALVTGVAYALPDIDLPDEIATTFHQEKDDALRAQRPLAVLREWENVIQRANPREVSLTAAALGETLRASRDAAVYREIDQRISDPMSSVDERLGLIEALQFAATPDSLGILLAYLDDLSANVDGVINQVDDPAEVTSKVREAIRIAARTPTIEGPNWALSPALERAWQNRSDDAPEADWAVLAEGLAFLGTDAGTQVLLASALDGSSEEARSAVTARKAISQIRNVDATPTLRDALDQINDRPETEQAILQGLASIGTADAAIVLLDYLKSRHNMTDEQIARVEFTMGAKQFPDESRKLFEDALAQADFGDDRIIAILQSAAAGHPESEESNGP
jgi:hypothetical protein